jgi:hypothetical protein
LLQVAVVVVMTLAVAVALEAIELRPVHLVVADQRNLLNL